jgi:hypothetical protein
VVLPRPIGQFQHFHLNLADRNYNQLTLDQCKDVSDFADLI